MRLNNIDLLAPKMIPLVRALADDLTHAYETGLTKTHFKVFETLRTGSRQAELFKQGTSKARVWQSAHNFGLAVDFVPWNDGSHGGLIGWNWDPANEYSFLAARAQKIGLATPINWDPCHVQHPDFHKLRRLWRAYFE